MAKLSPQQKLATGRLLVKRKAPYLYSAVMSLIPKEAPGLGTFGVTPKWLMYWDPAFAEACTPEQIAWVFIHEVSHVLRHHDDRRKKLVADPALWNCAADLEINDDIEAMHGNLPGEALYPKKFNLKDGELAESYYHQLRKQAKPEPKKGKGKDKGGGGEGSEGGGDEHEHPTPGSGWCGSGAGRKLPNEPEDEKEQGRSPADQERIRRHTAQEIQKEAAKSQGHVPAGWTVWANEIVKPAKIPWQSKLRRACRRAVNFVAGQMEFSYHRPARRQGAFGYGIGKPVRPTMVAPVPQILVFLDTSGSMMGESIQQAAAEIAGILKTTQSTVKFAAIDCATYGIHDLKHPREFAKHFVGGGGTSFTVAFDMLEKSRYRPNIVIYLTDGYGDAPAQKPAFVDRMLWVLCGNARIPYDRSGGDINWGEMLWVKDEDTDYKRA